VRHLEDEGSHAEGGGGGTSDVHGGSRTSELGGLGAGGSNTGARGHTESLGLGGNGTVVVRSSGGSDNRDNRSRRSRRKSGSALEGGDSARAVLNGQGGGSSHGDGVRASSDNGSGRAVSSQAEDDG
jgi:hypothetical protein